MLAQLPSTPPGSPWRLPPLLSASVGLHAAAAGAALLQPELMGWAAAAVVANHAGLAAAGLWPRSALLGPNLRRLPPAAAARGAIAITIDDGPDAEVTPAVLDLLAAHDVPATFFCIAAQARAQPALLRRIVAAGHSVQNHSHRHPHHFSLFGPAAMTREIGDAQALLSDITGVRPHCFRAPAGLRNPLLDPVLHRLGLHLVSWTRRGFDTREADPQRVSARLTRGLAAGDILLLHDGNARRTAAGVPVLLQVLPQLLAACRSARLQPVTLAQAVPARH
ncbi:MAG TPA: polysaccharide deacetylase family protein [Rubrivivax sp.]|nr:polysaccharide deacetylase family protein [Rubrivivax sp.]